MRFRVACIVVSISMVLAVAGCGGGSSKPVAPTITWSTPASIVYGTALSSTQLDASASVPGTFTYSPAAGAVPTAGTQTLSATFTPTDTSKYTSATASVTLTVTPATPAVTWVAPAGISYGTSLSATQLDASASVPGTFVYSPAAGQVLTAGSQSLSVTFTPTDATDYTTATATVSLAVSKATPNVTWATPAGIAYGTALSATQLDATASVPGAFVYTPAAGQVPAIGNQTLSVTFTPTDVADYTTAAASVTLAVGKATPAITWAAPADITYGTALSATQLDATASVPGTFVYSPTSGQVLTAGSQTLSVSFTPTDTTDYQSATDSVPLTVNQATPVITWATPAAVTVGAALGSTQLNATANVAGTFVYNPASGTILSNPDPLQLNTTFTPTDATDYTTATSSVLLTVNNPLVTVDYGTQDQLIRGFGGSTAWQGAMSTQQATALFDPVNGLGFSILRLRIDPEGSPAGGGKYGYPYETGGKSDPGGWDGELTNGAEAVGANPNAIVFASPWTPPPSMKIDSSVSGDGYQSPCSPGTDYCGGSLDVTNHGADYAQYLEDFVTFFNDNAGFDLYAISMQNEPNFVPQGSANNPSYESCYWSASDMDTWIANNASVITADPTYPTKLIMPEADSFQPSQAATALEDSAADALISIVAGHLYGVSPTAYPWPTGVSPKELWMTEHYLNSAGNITDAISTAEEVHASMVTGQYSAYVWWGMLGASTSVGNPGLIDSSNAPTNFGYGMGQFSKFIQPGYYRYNATPSYTNGVFISAYAGMEGTTQHYVIVAINDNADTATTSGAVSQPFTINNATVTTVTPYETTSAGGLMPQSAITVSGGAFTYTLPAQSITTFVQ